jgi:hypothetical protein
VLPGHGRARAIRSAPEKNEAKIVGCFCQSCIEERGWVQHAPLAIKGVIVTIDAAGTYAPIAPMIRDKQADYVLAVKDKLPQDSTPGFIVLRPHCSVALNPMPGRASRPSRGFPVRPSKSCWHRSARSRANEF